MPRESLRTTIKIIRRLVQTTTTIIKTLTTGKLSLIKNPSTSPNVEPQACLTALIPAARTRSCCTLLSLLLAYPPSVPFDGTPSRSLSASAASTPASPPAMHPDTT
jgi:hypothetical protein